MEEFKHNCQIWGFDLDGLIHSSYTCKHHKNKCSIICPKCPKESNLHACHTCHNSSLLGKDNEHFITNKDIEQVACMECKTIQNISPQCKNKSCGIKFCVYFCNVCKWLDSSKPRGHIYHCEKCNVCLNGQKSKYKHCDTCNVCIDKKTFSGHKCMHGEWTKDRECTICRDSIVSEISKIMVCGHIIHENCYKMLINSTYKCPECNKSIKDTTEEFRKIENDIINTPLPDELMRDANILCNDCEKKSKTSYHYVGLKCKFCKGYNTQEI